MLLKLSCAINTRMVSTFRLPINICEAEVDVRVTSLVNLHEAEFNFCLHAWKVVKKNYASDDNLLKLWRIYGSL